MRARHRGNRRLQGGLGWACHCAHGLEANGDVVAGLAGLGGIDNLGIGPAGLGGRVTALAVNIEMMPCHIASLPVAVNIQCHVARHKETTL